MVRTFLLQIKQKKQNAKLFRRRAGANVERRMLVFHSKVGTNENKLHIRTDSIN